jgi:hypothetical protein
MMATIQVLGTGCSKCGHLLKNAEKAVSQLNGNDSVEKVDDIVCRHVKNSFGH